MIFDCFIFRDEIDILELRLHELNPVVDRFVIAEAWFTFHGDTKPVFGITGLANRFPEFADKIDSVVVEEEPPVPAEFGRGRIEEVLIPRRWREQVQRDALAVPLQRIREQDVVIISDVDEIPNPDTLASFKCKGPWTGPPKVRLGMKHFMYDLHHLVPAVWPWPVAVLGKYFARRTPQEHRMLEPRQWPVRGAGWHLAYFGGPDAVRRKMETVCEFVRDPAMLKPETIAASIARGQDVLGRDLEIQGLQDPTYIPKYVAANRTKYQALGWI